MKKQHPNYRGQIALNRIDRRPKLGDWCVSNDDAQWDYKGLRGFVAGFNKDGSLDLAIPCRVDLEGEPEEWGAMVIPFGIEELDLLFFDASST